MPYLCIYLSIYNLLLNRNLLSDLFIVELFYLRTTSLNRKRVNVNHYYSILDGYVQKYFFKEKRAIYFTLAKIKQKWS